MKEATISARMYTEKKKKVEQVFSKLGLSHSSAINLFYSQILLKCCRSIFRQKLVKCLRKLLFMLIVEC